MGEARRRKHLARARREREERAREAAAKLQSRDLMTEFGYSDPGAMLLHASMVDPVPCNGCIACCVGHQSVALNSVWGDDPTRYRQEDLALEDVYGTGQLAVVLNRTPEGDCVFLDREKRACTNYNNRPAVCRSFDCRRVCREFAGEDRVTAMTKGIYPPAVFEAADERMHTLKLLPIEEEMDRIAPGAQALMLLTRARD
jgi:Fe-S-cluster containining protein